MFHLKRLESGRFDDKGEQVFTNEDEELILGLSADIYSALILAITRLNDLNGENNPKNLKKTS